MLVGMLALLECVADARTALEGERVDRRGIDRIPLKIDERISDGELHEKCGGDIVLERVGPSEPARETRSRAIRKHGVRDLDALLKILSPAVDLDVDEPVFIGDEGATVDGERHAG